MSGYAITPVDCSRCVTREECGSLPDAGLFGCFDYCMNECDHEDCDFTCPNNHRLYSERWIEVRGVGPVRLSSPAPKLSWPRYLPTIFGPYKRQKVAAAPWVAIPLAKLFRYGSAGEIRPVATDPDMLRACLRLRTDARILATGVDEDRHIERFWYHHRTAPLAAWLQAMGVETATAPNYSYFAYAPRDHYLWNRKRMLLFVEELGKGGFPVIPHIYAETIFDWEWWARFYRDHPTLGSFTLELQTSDALKDHLPSFLEGVKHFASSVGRPLTPIVVGGRRAISHLAPIFPNMVVTDASAYIKTVRRRVAVPGNANRVKWKSMQTTGPIDSLFDHNVRVMGDAITKQFSEALAQTEKTRIAGA